MNCRTVVWLGSFALLAGGHRLEAQTSKQPAKQPVRKGVARSAPPAQPVTVNTTGFRVVTVPVAPVPNSTGLYTNFVPPAAAPVVPVGAAPGIAQLTYYPTVVLSDGRVLANFGTGRGYEQVLRRCPQALPPNATIAPCWTVDAYGNYRVMQRR